MKTPKSKASAPCATVAWKRLYSVHAITCSPEGRVSVHTTKCEVAASDKVGSDKIKSALRALVGWEPADGFAHVIQQLRQGRTYVIRNGRTQQLEFAEG